MTWPCWRVGPWQSAPWCQDRLPTSYHRRSALIARLSTAEASLCDVDRLGMRGQQEEEELVLRACDEVLRAGEMAIGGGLVNPRI